MLLRPPRSTLLPYTTIFQSRRRLERAQGDLGLGLGPADRAGHRRHPPQAHGGGGGRRVPGLQVEERRLRAGALLDRKSTRLNSSHANISYAVFCLKKKIHYI